MIRVVHGIVRGKTIELDDNLGVADGQEVEVQVKVVGPGSKPGDGIMRSAGALADDTAWDGIMEEIHRGRKVERRSQE